MSVGRIKLYACHCGGCQPVRWKMFYTETHSLTISSGSSGKSVALPEPSFFSMLCLMSFMTKPISNVENEVRVCGS